jgi:hypothetical protein
MWQRQKNYIKHGLYRLEDQNKRNLENRLNRPDTFETDRKTLILEKVGVFMKFNVENYTDTIPASEGISLLATYFKLLHILI